MRPIRPMGATSRSGGSKIKSIFCDLQAAIRCLQQPNSPVATTWNWVQASVLCVCDTTRHKVQIFVVSAVLASLCGSLFAHYSGFISPAEGEFFRSIELVTMVVVGGMASTFGAVVGAAILTVLPQLLADFHDYEMLLFGAILMGMMIFLRKGLVPSLAELLRARRS